MSIEFVLTRELEIWRIDPVNEARVLIKKIVSDTGRLELAQSFADIWKKLFIDGVFDRVSQMTLIVGSDAGFTDTRIIYIWLKSAEMFDNITIYIVSNGQQGDNKNLSITQTNILTYSGEPRIGVKK